MNLLRVSTDNSSKLGDSDTLHIGFGPHKGSLPVPFLDLESFVGCRLTLGLRTLGLLGHSVEALLR